MAISSLKSFAFICSLRFIYVAHTLTLSGVTSEKMVEMYEVICYDHCWKLLEVQKVIDQLSVVIILGIR